MARPAGSARLLRGMNEAAALAYLFERGPLTRTDLRDLTGLSKPTASEVLRRLEDAGLAIVVGHSSSGPGPNAALYAANAEAGYIAALSVRDVGDLGQPSVSATLTDLAGRTRATVESDVAFGGADPVDIVADIVTELCRKAKISRDLLLQVQLGVPGSPDPRTGDIRYVDVPGLDRPGLVNEIRDRLKTEVMVDNDVNLAAIAERSHGVAAEVDAFTVLWLAGGSGFAIDQGGTLMRGAHGCAGELGYLPVPAVGTEARDFQDLVGGGPVLELGERFGFAGGTPQEVVSAAVAALGEDRAQEFLKGLAERVAIGLLAAITLIDPPLIVLAGEVSQAGGTVLRDEVVDALAALSPLGTQIEVTGVTGDAVLLGAISSATTAVQDRLLAGLTTPQQAAVSS
ncbi:putative NBD/HSP70 family sugar kinase [Kribbella voronezhensis]|uniref:Putative NBD/HSP70 family sugar kinase n=1 Tax=Kribbella voronezhensis TaxID=2512212 RepID=A0A4R7T9A4_9ACTN|nr:ROK family transcriptional regulator [Kribbella voronezhensis]TDU87767.1 putative NBD/HSP70 family sugar kinase [Kribbella voronezhensis]